MIRQRNNKAEFLKLAENIVSFLLILLFSYASLSKLIDYPEARSAMLNQPFPVWIGKILTWLVPLTELAICLLLLFSRSRRAGLYASVALLAVFSIYITLARLSTFGRVPCSCGGIISKLGWTGHLIMNLLFMLAAIIAIQISHFKHKDIAGRQKGEAENL